MQIATTYSLSELLREQGIADTEFFLRHCFHCQRNSDVEKFLHNKAIRFEQADAARTFLIIDDDFRILAYFSLSFKTVEFLNISNSLRKRLTGGMGENEAVKVFLIGQLAKNDIADNPIGLSDILNEAFYKIQQAMQLISGRVVILECENHPKLISLYETQGFKLIETKDNEMLKTLFIIPEM